MSVEYQAYIGIEGQDESKINTSEDDCWPEDEQVVLRTFDKLEDAEAFVGTCQQIDKLQAQLATAKGKRSKILSMVKEYEEEEFWKERPAEVLEAIIQTLKENQHDS